MRCSFLSLSLHKANSFSAHFIFIALTAISSYLLREATRDTFVLEDSSDGPPPQPVKVCRKTGVHVTTKVHQATKVHCNKHESTADLLVALKAILEREAPADYFIIGFD